MTGNSPASFLKQYELSGRCEMQQTGNIQSGQSGRTSRMRSSTDTGKTFMQSSKRSQKPEKGDTLIYLDLTADGRQGGGIVGNAWSLAWRQYDAQYYGLPQRRKRIFLICDLVGRRAGKVLFESEGGIGDITPCGEERKTPAAGVEGSTGRTDKWLIDNHAQDCRCTLCEDVCVTLNAKMGTGGGNTPIVVKLND